MAEREGPEARLDCRGCKHLRVEQINDSGQRETYCRAADVFIGNEAHGQDLFTTPLWCPCRHES